MSASGPWHDVWSGFLRAGAIALLVASASMVGAAGYALHDRALWVSVVVAMLLWSPPAATLLVGVELLGQLVLQRASPRSRALAASLFAMLSALTWLVQMLLGVAAVQFFIERGTSITIADIEQGTDLGFIGSQASILFGPLYGPALGGGAVACLAVGAWRWRRRERARPGGPAAWARGVVGAMLALAVLYGAGQATRASDRGKSAMKPFLQLSTLSYAGFATLIDSAPRDEASVRAGAALIGLPAADTCPALAVPLQEGVSDGAGAALDQSARAYGQALFSERQAAFSIWIVALESLGGDDVAALEPSTPGALTPYLDELYSPRDAWFASPSTLQAGVRTAQALSAVLCGLGSVAHRVAVLRDLPGLPLRCLSDVLVAAGARARFFYGSDPEFDRTSGSLKEHGFTEISVPTDPKLPRGGWGVSDRALFDHALEQVGRDAAAPTLQVLFTLSTHSPFRRPEDFPPELAARVDPALASLPADETLRAHLAVVAYADFALQRFLPALLAREEERGRLPFVLVVGDHASGIGRAEPGPARGRVPFVLWVPECASQGCARARAQLGRSFESTPLSQNDLPRLVLALLEASPALRALPPEERWHTIGGQTLSPHFRAGAGGARWSNAGGWAWLVDGNGSALASAPTQLLESASQVEKDTSFCAPSASVLGWAARRCRP